jgi:hypothetical protein
MVFFDGTQKHEAKVNMFSSIILTLSIFLAAFDANITLGVKCTIGLEV